MELHRRFLETFGADKSVFIVTRNVSDYKVLCDLNQVPTCEFAWFGQDLASDNESVSTIGEGDIELEFGVLAISEPAFIPEKRKAHLPMGIILGRKSSHRNIDVLLGPARSKKKLSRVHAVLEPKENCWTIRNIGKGKLVVHGDVALRQNDPFLCLHPYLPNEVMIGELALEIYCNPDPRLHRSLADRMQKLQLDYAEPSADQSSVSLSTIATDSTSQLFASDSDSSDQDARMYILDQEELGTRNETRKFIAIDAWTGERFVAKAFPVARHQRGDRLIELEKRLELLQKLPVHEAFIKDERIYETRETLYLLGRYRDETTDISDDTLELTPRMARRLLWALLRLTCRLHLEFGIVHGDIGSSTVFFLYPHETFPEILLGGFSEASKSSALGCENDFIKVFQTVETFVDRIPDHLPNMWVGHMELDALRLQFASGDSAHWMNVYDLVASMGKPESHENMWTEIKVQRKMEVHYTVRRGIMYLNAGDVEEYVRTDARNCVTTDNDRNDIASIIQGSYTALGTCTRNGEITADDYEHFLTHMEENHRVKFSYDLSRHISDEDLSHKKKSTIHFTMSFKVPYNCFHGLVNVEYLRHFAASGIDTGHLEQFVGRYLELRGPKQYAGVYAPVTILFEIVSMLQLRYAWQIPRPRLDRDLSMHTSEQWYLFALNESSRLYPVEKETRLVSVRHGHRVQLGRFLQDFVPRRDVLNAHVEHDPNLIAAASREGLPVAHSCGGSVTGDVDLSFRWRDAPKSSILPEKRTSEWIRERTKTRRLTKK